MKSKSKMEMILERTRKKKTARPWSTSKMSIEFNSLMCKQILGDECRHVHETMEGVKRRPAKAKQKRGSK